MYTLSTYEEKLAGVNIGKKTIRQSSTQSLNNGVSYFISLPPYYNYETVSTENNLQHPYDYNSLSVNKINTHLAYTGIYNDFNPFARLISIDDIAGNSLNITHNVSFVNNMTFRHLQPKNILALSNNTDSTRYGITVPGVKLTIYLYNGLYNSTSLPQLIYEGPITSISSTLDVLSNSLVLRNRDEDGSINFSVLQKPQDIGYPSGLSGYQQVFRTNEQTYYYNIDFNFGNVAWFNNNSPVTYFNAKADGISPTLYTVVDLNNPITKVNSRRVYKYESTLALKIDDTNVFQTFSLVFNSGRSYYDVVVNQPNFSSDSTATWDYSDMVSNTNIGNLSSITWTSDTEFADSVYVNWSFGNAVTGQYMPIDLFFVENEVKKWVYITLLPFQSLLNQYGLVVNETSWDGSVYAPLVSTRVLSMQPLIDSPILYGVTYQMEQYSTSSLNN
jgi:hypothetical protein